MGHVKATIKVSNPTKADLKSIDIICLVDTGATYLCLPQHVANQLELKELQKREVILANGLPQLVPYVGPVKVEFENRICFVGAMVIGDQPLLGAIPMEDMDLVVHPSQFKLSVNPASPNIATGLAK